jgi:hypothetical protein
MPPRFPDQRLETICVPGRSVRIRALLHFPKENALDTAKQYRILPKLFVLFGYYRKKVKLPQTLLTPLPLAASVPFV